MGWLDFPNGVSLNLWDTIKSTITGDTLKGYEFEGPKDVVDTVKSSKNQEALTTLNNTFNINQNSQPIFDWSRLNSTLDSYFKNFTNSATDLEIQEAAKNRRWQEQQNKNAMDFESTQAALNRLFQQTSADKAMKFEAEQAQILRDWQVEQNKTAMDYESAEAEKDRSWQELQAQNAMDFEAKQAEKNRSWQEQQNKKAMDFEAEQAQKAMDYSRMMSNTAYQRAIADMQAAGLNPILAYAQGGASSPAGIAGSGFSSSGSSASGFMGSGSKGSGYTSSGSRGSGYSSSGSKGSGYTSSGSKANIAGGKSVDTGIFKNIFTSAAALLSAIGSAIGKKK